MSSWYSSKYLTIIFLVSCQGSPQRENDKDTRDKEHLNYSHNMARKGHSKKGRTFRQPWCQIQDLNFWAVFSHMYHPECNHTTTFSSAITPVQIPSLCGQCCESCCSLNFSLPHTHLAIFHECNLGIFLAPSKLRQEDWEFKDSLGYILMLYLERKIEKRYTFPCNSI